MAATAPRLVADQLARPRVPVLRFGSHNVCGLTTVAAAQQAAASWRQARYDVVAIQEHKLTLFTATRVARRLAQLGWTFLFAITPGGACGQAGTAIAYRTSLRTTGSLVLVGGDQAVLRAADGRYIAVPLNWCGHDLHVCSVYLPSGDPTAQRQYLATHLQPLAVSAGNRQLLWGGDFNFVPCPHLDRLHHQPGTSHPDIGTQARWQAAFPQLVDAWRHRHPHRRTYTFISSSAASRLDRFYVSPALIPCVAVCSIQSCTTSDHRPVSLTLVGRQPSTTGPGRRRVRLGFAANFPLSSQFDTWLRQHAAGAPADPQALLLWWPQFKHQLVRKCGELHRASRQLNQAAEQAGQHLAALHDQFDAGDDTVLPALLSARQRFTEAAAASHAAAALQRRQQWLHSGERPCPALTRRLRPPKYSRQVPALRSTSGRLLHRGSACAQRVAAFWAAVSADPATDVAARQEVLAALEAGRRLGVEQAARLGRSEVQEAEVLHALRRGPSGRSPGHDGIPLELYRQFKPVFAPLLARLFTAIAATDSLPSRFHEGLITIIYKAGEVSDPANYRPISLLCTDYRIYAKILSLRLNPCLPAIIDPEQTAFVPGRRIGENVLTLQCLTDLLRRQRRSAYVVFCDFRKAYDTIDRSFLFAAMQVLGVGTSFLGLVRRLLTATSARAIVNDWVSTPAQFAAGVRQGCPLAPLLYLFVAQALLRLLKSRGIGIQVAGQLLTALQYADDTEALLPSLEQLPAFLDAVRTFAAATGQHLNPSKSRLLPIGALPPDLPPTSLGLQLVTSATALGIAFGPAADPSAAWPALVTEVERGYTRLANLPRTFSIFGRGFATAAYGVSKLLYHAEFAGHPPAAHLARLSSVTAKVVERGLAPADTRHRFAGLPGWLLPGRPAAGGFGALPWHEHITSRHAWWGLRLILEPATTPWVAVARELLLACAGEVGGRPLGFLLWPASQLLPGMVAPLPPPLRRLHNALACLPRVTDVACQPLPHGAWCWAAPLWGNPFFATAHAGNLAAIDFAFFDFAAAGISTLGQLLCLEAAITAHPTQSSFAVSVWPGHLRRSYAFVERHHAATRVQQLLAALPGPWVAAGRAAAAGIAAGQREPTPADALAIMLPRLGWTRPGGAEPLFLADFTVRAGTAILTAPTQRRRVEEHLRPFATRLGGTVPELQALLRRLWRLPWENCHKEPFWRLIYDAFPTAARMHLDQPCICGAAPADLEHHFWGCPVAAAVVASVSATLSAHRPPIPPPCLADLWLARPPASVHGGVWAVVCLAAVAAMGSGRRRMYALRVGGPVQPPPAASLVTQCARFAVARFWSLLTDFVALRRIPASWQARCPFGHPFICYDSHSASFVVDGPTVAPATPTH